MTKFLKLGHLIMTPVIKGRRRGIRNQYSKNPATNKNLDFKNLFG